MRESMPRISRRQVAFVRSTVEDVGAVEGSSRDMLGRRGIDVRLIKQR